MASTSTLLSALLRTQPAMPRMCASRSTNQRKPTPCTRPRTRKRRACVSLDIRLRLSKIPDCPFMLKRSCGNSLMRGELVLDDHSAFHDELDVLEFANVGDRISRNSDDVCIFSCLDRSDFVLPSHQFGSVGCSGVDRFKRRHSKFGHGNEFAGVLAVRLRAGG